MKNVVILLGAISLSIVAMDENQKEVNTMFKNIEQLGNIKFIEVSSESGVYTKYDQKMISDLCNIYRWYFEDMQRRDLQFCKENTFKLRMPSYYLQQFQAKQFPSIKNQISSLKNIWFFFSSSEYVQMDAQFKLLYEKHEDVEKTWDQFITYFLTEHVINPIIGKKYYKMPTIIPML